MRVPRPSCRGRPETGRVAVGRARPQNAAYKLLAAGHIAMVVGRTGRCSGIAISQTAFCGRFATQHDPIDKSYCHKVNSLF